MIGQRQARRATTDPTLKTHVVDYTWDLTRDEEGIRAC